MTRNFNSTLRSFVNEAEPEVVNNNTVASNASWLKKVTAALSTYYGGFASNGTFIEHLYNFTNVGFLAQKNIDLEYYAVQDLLRQLFTVTEINPAGVGRRVVLQWNDFVISVEKNINNPRVVEIFKKWYEQIRKDQSEYVIQDSAIFKYYTAKLKEKDIAATVAYNTYSKDTIYNALRKMLQKRLTASAQFSSTVVKKVTGGIAQYEQVLLNVLLQPEKYANADSSFPNKFTEDCDVSPEVLRNIGLICQQLYDAEIGRVIMLSAEKKAADKIPFKLENPSNEKDAFPFLDSVPVTPGQVQKPTPQQGEFNLDTSGQQELDLSSIQYTGNICEFRSFSQHRKILKRINEASAVSALWQRLKQNITRGPAAAQAVHVSITQFIKKLTKKPAVKPEYQLFLKQGYIRTSVTIPNTVFEPGAQPVFNVNVVIDSTAVKVNNSPLIYTLEVIGNLKTAESERLVALLKGLAERTSVELTQGEKTDRAIATLAARL